MMERRERPRFPFVEIAAYRVLDTERNPVVGIGQTVNMSGTGVLLRVQHDLRVGRRVELSLGLLMARGRVIRFHSGCAAIAFDDPPVWGDLVVPRPRAENERSGWRKFTPTRSEAVENS